MAETQGVISELTIYPVKSLQGIQLKQAELTEYGLKWDRFWMIVNEDGLFTTQRHFNDMAKVKTQLTNESLILSYPGMEDLIVSLEPRNLSPRSAKVWKSECEVWDEGETAQRWLAKALGKWRGQTLSLVRMAPSFNRKVSENHTDGASNNTFFADGYPYLVCNTASLTALNTELIKQDFDAVSMSRFRGNIVVDTTDAFVEHNSKTLSFYQSSQQLHLCKPCQRCKVITIDQRDGSEPQPQQPFKTLSNMDHVNSKGAFFGQNAVVAEKAKSLLPITIAIGDKVSFS